jgi:hypothetical protein
LCTEETILLLPAACQDVRRQSTHVPSQDLRCSSKVAGHDLCTQDEPPSVVLLCDDKRPEVAGAEMSRQDVRPRYVRRRSEGPCSKRRGAEVTHHEMLGGIEIDAAEARFRFTAIVVKLPLCA